MQIFQVFSMIKIFDFITFSYWIFEIIITSDTKLCFKVNGIRAQQMLDFHFHYLHVVQVLKDDRFAFTSWFFGILCYTNIL